ncbi:unnamed protein product [Heterobilharzia americana]|nr:unnamed protein product [Heterobilharzia americana]
MVALRKLTQAIDYVGPSVGETGCFIVHLEESRGRIFAGVYLEYTSAEYEEIKETFVNNGVESVRRTEIKISDYFMKCDARASYKDKCESGDISLNDPRRKLCDEIPPTTKDIPNTESVHTTPVHSTTTSHDTGATASVSLASVATIFAAVMLVRVF